MLLTVATSNMTSSADSFRNSTALYPISIAREKPIHVIRELTFLIVLADCVEESFSDVGFAFSVRDLDRTIQTVVWGNPIKCFRLVDET